MIFKGKSSCLRLSPPLPSDQPGGTLTSCCQRTAYRPQQSEGMLPKRRKRHQHPPRLRSRGRSGSPTRSPSDPTSLARALRNQAWLNKNRRPPTLAPTVCLATLMSDLTKKTKFLPYFVFSAKRD